MEQGSWLERLVGGTLSRRLADAAFRVYASRRVAGLDRDRPARDQERTLLRLVRAARRTRFGREHGFADIRSVADYQERVRPRSYEAFWAEYWQPAFPRWQGVTWPGPVPYLALSSGTTSGSTKYVPVSREMAVSNRRAGLTALALFQAFEPAARLFAGRIFFLGGSTDLALLAPGVRAGDLSGIVACELPALLRPYTFPPLALALERDWERKLDLLARGSVGLPVTAVSGVPSWLLVLFERVLRLAGRERLIEVWPSLRLVLHGGTRFDPYRARFRELAGAGVQFQEVYPASEGFLAVEDPRFGLLRLLTDHGLFYEFIPVGELESASPTRHTVANLEPGENYAVVLTTCAGLWSYVLGDTVRFERREPLLLQFTGRTRYFLSAFGEHLISEEVERAVATAAEATGAAVTEFHVGPVFPEAADQAGRHRFLVEFARPPGDLGRFAAVLDEELARLNEDYAAHRRGDLTMRGPEVLPAPAGGFAGWLKSRGKLGGQHKVPRMDPAGDLTRELTAALIAGSGPAYPHC